MSGYVSDIKVEIVSEMARQMAERLLEALSRAEQLYSADPAAGQSPGSEQLPESTNKD